MSVHSAVRRVLMSIVRSAAAAATAACSSAATPVTAESQRAPGQKPLTAAELTDALPVDADFPGFTAEPQSMSLLEAEEVVTVDNAACRPIADMMSVHPKRPREAMAWATLKANDAPLRAAPGSVTLTSHADDDAQVWMRELEDALAKCNRFTASSERGWTHRFQVKPLPSVTVGDDSVAYILTSVLAPGGKGNVITVVRTGGTFATYLMNQDADRPSAIPASIAGRQHKKLQLAAAEH
ncbi:hypothetical protein OG883_15320 [Streptomyces sp. NBC_01142]|uniref:hypothetical protein n=1 Tax=Streptomyces sp. NBC_01142 TaxID=2975865 RepID=UPI00225406A9|nr:hypothetical protein [Streptomyces sp. NBC_01142]MCX4821255.1 hypothetical protein [Streptomyces sp. NBC_01142]